MKVEISRDELIQTHENDGLITGNRSKSDIEAQLYLRNKFCICIEMKLGINLIGIFIYLDFLMFVINTTTQILDEKVKNNWFPGIYAIAHLGMIMAMAKYYIYWRSEDSFKNRS